MDITVEVTEDHIDTGVQQDCKYCPTASAIRDAIAKQKLYEDFAVRVTGRAATIFIYRQPVVVQLPDSVSEFVQKYDRGEQVHPFSFVLEGLPMRNNAFEKWWRDCQMDQVGPANRMLKEHAAKMKEVAQHAWEGGIESLQQPTAESVVAHAADSLLQLDPPHG